MPEGLDGVFAVAAYAGTGARLVASVKYGSGRVAVPWLARRMAPLVAGIRFDLVTWVPTTTARRRERGFDHARLLARRISRETGVRCAPTLRRLPGPAQTGRSAADRHIGPAFVARRAIDGRSVLVVDDVLTTGSTLRRAAEALRGAGGTQVFGLVAARTPLKARR
ncbi:MAG TPA: phosphoribosyltransferase family protein [Acidimicrobiales bacterium]|nr:phosphoribosyltransferase family protein [Acidimicrobiales bacterium]